jgi:hypothetical protein
LSIDFGQRTDDPAAQFRPSTQKDHWRYFGVILTRKRRFDHVRFDGRQRGGG